MPQPTPQGEVCVLCVLNLPCVLRPGQRCSRSDHHLFVCLQGNAKITAEPRPLWAAEEKAEPGGGRDTRPCSVFSSAGAGARSSNGRGQRNKRASARGVSFPVFCGGCFRSLADSYLLILIHPFLPPQCRNQAPGDCARRQLEYLPRLTGT
jgi:hypothetical protein